MFLKTRKKQIVDGKGREVRLRGVNLGGWLMMEGYILNAPNIAEHIFKKSFQKKLGARSLAQFEQIFRDAWITESDFANIERMGFNCVRVPFNCRLIELQPYRYSRKGVEYLDRVMRWAQAHKLWVILDLHAAPGSQNHDWHGDSDGRARLWGHVPYQHRTIALWEFLADRYKDCPALAGYDLLNEGVIADAKKMNALYHKLIAAIRSVDKNHILFIEGNKWATDVNCLDEFDDGNHVISIHSYEPIDFTFNFVPHLSYHKISGKSHLKRHLDQYHCFARERQCPIFVGEFGVNVRAGSWGEDQWLKDNIALFEEMGFHWTYWTYKAIKNSAFPDGIYSFYDNPPWVNRLGPRSGWDTFALHWPSKKVEMAASWKTERFVANQEIINALCK